MGDRTSAMPENSKQFMRALAVSAAQHCPLHWTASCRCTPLELATRANEADAVNILIQRDSTLVNDAALKTAISYSYPNVVEILMESAADAQRVAMREWCRQQVRESEYRYQYNSINLPSRRWSKPEFMDELYNLQRLREIDEILKENERKRKRNENSHSEYIELKVLKK